MKDILESSHKSCFKEIDIRKRGELLEKRLELLEKMKDVLESSHKRSCREIVIRKKARVIRKNEGCIRI